MARPCMAYIGRLLSKLFQMSTLATAISVQEARSVTLLSKKLNQQLIHRRLSIERHITLVVKVVQEARGVTLASKKLDDHLQRLPRC